jgi:hypothetical protein
MTSWIPLLSWEKRMLSRGLNTRIAQATTPAARGRPNSAASGTIVEPTANKP